MPIHKKSTDVIIVGAGFAGLAAAIEAKEAGAEVIVLEKMRAAGGNSIISEGCMAAPGTAEQQAKGIEDSPALMYRDMIKAGEGLNHPALVKVVTEEAKEAYLWSKDFLGVKYLDRVDQFGGHSVARCYTTESVSGMDLIKKQLARLKALNVPVHTGIYVKHILTGPDGRIKGTRINEDYHYKKGTAGPEKELQADQAVIIASGGFGSDISFRRAQDPRLDNLIMSTNKLFATAEVLKECLAAGANPVQLSRIQLFPWASPYEKGFGAGSRFGNNVVLGHGLIVDPKTGARFINELCNRKDMGEALINLGRPAVGITDENGVVKAGWDISRALKKGVVKTFLSLEELGGHFGIDSRKLKNSIARYNDMIKAGQDDDFNKIFPSEASPVNTPPFYAMEMWPKVHYTMGGIQIDSCARVINRDQQPIKGLFAAGEVTGGIHGACRLGSCAITECLVMGRIAGKNATG